MMKKISISILACLALFLSNCSNSDKTKDSATTQDSVVTSIPESGSDKAPMDSAACAQAMELYMTPGDMHKWMSLSDGKWEADMTFWMGPGTQAMPGGKSTVENKMILGGRYQQTDYKGKMMGMDYEGHGMMGYDNAKKKFIQTWIDNTGTGMLYMEGTYDENKKVISFTGKMMNPATSEEGEMRQVLTIIDDKNQVLEMYNIAEGKEFKSMEIKLVKK